jgi:hypothetical protein
VSAGADEVDDLQPGVQVIFCCRRDLRGGERQVDEVTAVTEDDSWPPTSAASISWAVSVSRCSEEPSATSIVTSQPATATPW